MKWLKECPLTAAIIIVGIALTVFGFVGRGSLLSDYRHSWQEAPILSVSIRYLGEMLAGGTEDLIAEAKDVYWEVYDRFIQKENRTEDDALAEQQSNSEFSKDESGEEVTGYTEEGQLGPAPIVEGSQSVDSGLGPPPLVETQEEQKTVTGYKTVDDSYFDDALFVGDSRIKSLMKYADMSNATFYAETGLTIYNLLEKDIARLPGEKKDCTVEEALAQQKFGKIYIMVGINEMGRGTVETYLKQYQDVLTRIRELQPDALIYVQAIMRINESVAKVGSYITNAGIDERNAGLAQFADGEHIFYLDVNEVVCDDNGQLIEEYTFDGVHLQAVHVPVWKEFLYSHAVDYP